MVVAIAFNLRNYEDVVRMNWGSGGGNKAVIRGDESIRHVRMKRGKL